MGEVRCDCFPGFSGDTCATADPPALVGTLPGALTVNLSGQATYSVPLEVPIGVGGLVPTLSLDYRGQRLNGPLGMGWSVGGLSAIHRCPKTLGQDGAPAPIEDDDTDAFCLDGQRLVAIAGAYGQDGTEYRTEIESFARIVSTGAPGSGSGYTGPSTFEVWTADGRMLTFGEGASVESHGSVRRLWALSSLHDRSGNVVTIGYRNASVPASCTPGPCASTGPLPSVIAYGDRQIAFQYETRGDTQSRYERGLLSVLQDRLESISMSVAEQAQWTYRLQYDEFGEASHLVELTQCSGDSLDQCLSPTRLSYDGYGIDGGVEHQTLGLPVGPNFGNGPDSLKFGSTLVLDADGDGRDDLLFPFQVMNSSPAIWTYHLRLGTDGQGSAAFRPDIETGFESGDGSGAIDYPCFSQNSVVDFDHDGRDDLVDQCFSPFTQGWNVYLSTGSGFTRTPLPFLQGRNRNDRIYVADMDGDGWPDIVSCELNLPNPSSLIDDTLKLYRNLGAGQGFAAPVALPRVGSGCQVSPLFIDVDGDGVVNMLRPERNVYLDVAEFRPLIPHQVWKALVLHAPDGSDAEWIDAGITTDYADTLPSGDYSWYATDPMMLSSFAQAWQVKPIDYNGDGLVDVLQYEQTASQDQRVSLFINTGSGFVKSPVGLTIADPDDDNYAFYRAQVVDLNGDGRQDLLMPQGSPGSGAQPLPPHWVAYTSVDQGGPFLEQPAAAAYTVTSLDPFAVPVVMDHDGDGDQEIVLSDGDWGSFSWNLSLIEPHSEWHHLLTDVTDGLERDQSIAYDGPDNAPGRDPRHAYTVTRPCPPTVQCPRRVTPLVRSITETLLPTGSENPAVPYDPPALRSTEYAYADAAVGLFGRGWLGFASIVQTVVAGDTQAGTAPAVSTTTTTFDNTTLLESLPGTSATRWYPYAGQVTQRVIASAPSPALGGGTVVRTDTLQALQREVLVSHDGRPFAHTKEVKESWQEKPAAGTGAPSTLFVVDDTTSLDDYGNLVSSTASLGNGAGGQLELRTTNEVHNVTAADRASWLIRLPDSRTVTSQTDEGTTTREDTFTHWPTGLPWTHTREPNQPTLQRIDTWTYYPVGNVQTFTRSDGVDSANDRTDTFFYDPANLLLVQRIDAAKLVWGYAFDPSRGVLLSTTDPNSLVSGRTYDAFGRVKREYTPTSSTTVTYDVPDPAWPVALGRLQVTGTTSGGDQVATVYDAAGRALEERSSGYFGATVIVDQSYDFADRVVRASRPHLPNDTSQGELRYVYDALGRTVSETRPDEAAAGGTVTVQYAYAAATSAAARASTMGWDASTTKAAVDVIQRDEAGHVEVRAVEPHGQLVAVRDALGSLTQYRYEAFSLPSRVTDAAGNVTTIHHDPAGRVMHLVDPDRGTEDTTYTAFDDTHTVTNAKGTVTFLHDALGRIQQRSDEAGNLNGWRYDGTGPAELNRLVEAWTQAADGTTPADTVYAYVPAGAATGQGLLDHETRTIGGQTFVTARTYDPYGRTKTLTYPSGGGAFSLQDSYDDYGHLTTVKDAITGAGYWSLTKGDEGYRVGVEQFGNGTQTQWTYKPLSGRLDTLDTTAPLSGAPSSVQHVGYAYDVFGNVTSRTDGIVPANTRQFSYDPLNRLHIVSGADGTELDQFEYSPIGNLASRTTVGAYGYNGPQPHAATSAGTTQYQYDPLGQQSARSGPLVAGQTQTLLYTSFGMPSEVQGPGGVATADFTYDADDRRVRMVTPSADTFYAGDLYQEQHAGGSVEYRYRIFAGDREVAQVTQSSDDPLHTRAVKYLHPDGLGSTDTVSDDALSIQRVQYDAYGSVVGGSLASAGVTSGFTGQTYDEGLGLVDMKGRLYDPKLAHFVSPDPFVTRPDSSQGLNRYAYAFNNPLKYVDPSGFQAVDLGVAPGDTQVVTTIQEPPAPAAEPAGPTLGDRLYAVGQVLGGFVAGVGAGLVPGGALAEQGARARGWIAQGTGSARIGLAVGEVVGGAVTTVAGASGQAGGFVVSWTGLGALVGVPAIAVSTTAVVGGVANVAAGVKEFGEALQSTGSGSGSGGGIRENAAKGAAWEAKVGADLTQKRPGTVGQVTVKTPSGVRARVDFAGRDPQTGQVVLTEAKASATAPLTKGQAAAYPEVATTGGTVVGKGKPGFPGGTVIPPTSVDIVRP